MAKLGTLMMLPVLLIAFFGGAGGAGVFRLARGCLGSLEFNNYNSNYLSNFNRSNIPRHNCHIV